MATWAQTSGVQMRRRVVLGTWGVTFVPTVERDTRHAALASVLVSGPPPPLVPVEDPGQHARTREGVAQRVLVRPAANLATPTATYVGRGINVVRI